MSNIDSIDALMGFDPTNLEVFHEKTSSDSYSANIYRTRVAETKSEDGHYYSKIKIIYNPFDIRHSTVHQATYSLEDGDGKFFVVSKLSNNDKSCPIFQAFRKLWWPRDTSVQESNREFVKQHFNKSENDWVLVQVMEDKNHPELVGQFKLFRVPRVIFNKMLAKMNPTADSGEKPVPVMDYLIGPVLKMNVIPGPDDPSNPSRKTRETKYDMCDFASDYTPITKTDGTPLFTESELTTIDDYYTARIDSVSGKTEDKRQRALARVNELTPAIKELYRKALEYVKENAPDLVDECGYKEWSEDVAARVQRWVDAVSQLKDPLFIGGSGAPALDTAPGETSSSSSASQPAASFDPFADVASESSVPSSPAGDDDLPF